MNSEDTGFNLMSDDSERLSLELERDARRYPKPFAEEDEVRLS